MKHFLIPVLIGLFFLGCSSDKDESPTEVVAHVGELEFSSSITAPDSVVFGDSITMPYQDEQSRGWQNKAQLKEMYLVTNLNGERQSIPVRLIGSENPIVKFTLSAGNNQVYASYSRNQMLLNGPCVLSTHPQGIAENYGQEKTPSKKPAYEAFDDKFFMSEPFEIQYVTRGFLFKQSNFEITYRNRTYEYNEDQEAFESRGRLLFIDMNRKTSKIRANLVLLNHNFLIIKIMTESDFNSETKTKLSDWKFRTFISGVAESYDPLSGNLPASDKVEALMAKPEKMEGGQITFLDGIYEGVGRIYEENKGYSFILPTNTAKAKLCYSFYYSKGKEKPGKKECYRKYNTLEIPISALRLDPNVENDVIVTFYVEDLIEAMTFKAESKAANCTRDDENFGVVMDIPYEVIVKHK